MIINFIFITVPLLISDNHIDRFDEYMTENIAWAIIKSISVNNDVILV